ncbi:beta-lactamase [Podospora didyma]|uniref:Beta-lactamase n=1 Tax=Podospora didyma TaxID=330526 RepID=A0AAE0NQZ3_9PEZI|nr:beta-lactamase [Podospora didyma]
MADKLLDSILAKYAAQGDDTKDKLLGAAFVVVSKDGTLYQGAAGRIDIPPASPAFGADSFAFVASLTKIVTSTCILRAVERGLVGLDDDARGLVPALGEMQILRGFGEDGSPILEDNTKPITLRRLLTHTVGLGYDIADPDLTRWSKAVGRTITNLSFTNEGFITPLKFAPGEGWYYGTAIDWAGRVLEKVSGRGLGEYMAEHVFKPLGMQDSTFRPLSLAERTKDRTAVFSYRDPATGLLKAGEPPIPLDPPVESGGAGLWTTAVDHIKVLQALLKADGSVLKKESVDELFRPQLDEVQHAMLEELSNAWRQGLVPEFPAGTPINYGLGGIINTEDVPGKRRKGSMMWLGMCNTHWWVDRETSIGATLILNVQPHGDAVVNSLYDELELAVYGELVPAWRKGGVSD